MSNAAVALKHNGNGNGSDGLGALVESVLVKGDLSKLTPQERNAYYLHVCDSAGLNPLTKPFEYITLNGKLTLYALRNCTDQLRTIHNVSVEDLTESEREGVFIVTAKVRNGAGRTDIAKGAVNISGLKGEALANALMKAETKAKRRATLSICGLGLLDETEVEDIPAAAKKPEIVKPAANEPLITQEQMDTLIEMLEAKGAAREGFLAWAKVERFEDIPAAFYDSCVSAIQQYRPKAKA